MNATPETPRITADFCKDTTQRLVFEPKTIAEAAFIAEQLMGMGYRYYKAEYAQQLQNALEGSIYLDRDKTIMVATSKPTDQALACSVDGFKQFFIPEAPLAEDARIKGDDCLRRTLAFYPRTNGEARSILTALMKAGVECKSGDDSAAMMMTHSIVYGILVRDGCMSFGPTSQDLIGAEICSAADLGVRAGVSLSAEQATIMAAFNEMGARMEQMSQRIARLEDEILPQSVSKPFQLKLKPKP